MLDVSPERACRGLPSWSVGISRVMLTLACASSCTGVKGDSHRAPTHQLDVITGAELRQAGAQDAFQALVLLRPNLVARSGGVNGMSETLPVYVDGRLVGGTEVLSQIPTSWIATMRYITASTPDSRFRVSIRGGAVAITTVGARP